MKKVVSKKTVKRVLDSFDFNWRRIKKKVKGKKSEDYEEKKIELNNLKVEHKKGNITLYYFDESGFCLIPYVPCLARKRENNRS